MTIYTMILKIRWVHCNFYISSRLPPFHNTTCSAKTLQWVSSPGPKTARGFQQVEDQMPYCCDLKKASRGPGTRCRCLSERATCHEQCLAWRMEDCWRNIFGNGLKQMALRYFWILGIIFIKICVYCWWLCLLIDNSNIQIHHIDINIYRIQTKYTWPALENSYTFCILPEALQSWMKTPPFDADRSCASNRWKGLSSQR